MNNKLRVFLVLMFIFCTVQLASAQGGQVNVYYCLIAGDEPPLGCGCELATRVPFPLGTSVCIFWDNNANGPDDQDVIVPLGNSTGECGQNCWSLNCLYDGYFYTDPGFYVENLPVAPDTALYYFRISGENCCFVSTVFRLSQGLNDDIVFTAADWQCEGESCCSGYNVPAAPTNLTVSEDEYCLTVNTAWNHTGESVTGFTVYLDEVPAITLGPGARDILLSRCQEGEVEVSIRALNVCESSDIVSATGSTYLRRFAPGIGGNYDGGSEIDIHLTMPPLPGGYCSAYLWFDLFSNNQYVARLCSLVDATQPEVLDLTCTLPNSELANCFIVMHDTNATTGCGGTDTTETFNITVDAETTPGIAREFSLNQNYPNPFNPDTRIEFTIPTDDQVILAIYDLQGRLVNTLISAHLPAGRHAADWRATTQDGSPVAAGLYFYQLRTGSHVETRKMLLIK